MFNTIIDLLGNGKTMSPPDESVELSAVQSTEDLVALDVSISRDTKLKLMLKSRIDGAVRTKNVSSMGLAALRAVASDKALQGVILSNFEKRFPNVLECVIEVLRKWKYEDKKAARRRVSVALSNITYENPGKRQDKKTERFSRKKLKVLRTTKLIMTINNTFGRNKRQSYYMTNSFVLLKNK
jgi:hypothetical protein